MYLIRRVFSTSFFLYHVITFTSYALAQSGIRPVGDSEHPKLNSNEEFSKGFIFLSNVTTFPISGKTKPKFMLFTQVSLKNFLGHGSHLCLFRHSH